MKTFVLGLIGVFGICSSANASNLVLNGSFETTAYSVGYGCGDLPDCYFGISDPTHAFPHGPTAFAPWSFAGGSGVSLVGSLVGDPGSEDGNQYAFLQGASTVSQSITAAAGQTLQLTFFVANRTNAGQSGERLSVSLGGTTFTVLPNNSTLPSGWSELSDSFVGTGSAQTLTFTTTGGGAVLLDNVSLTTVAAPEPASFLLMGFGILVPVVLRKRAVYSKN